MWFSKRESQYKKLEVALEKLSQEQDIMNVIKQNRLGRLLIKMHFSALDRHTASHASEYVINDQDLLLAAKERDLKAEADCKKTKMGEMLNTWADGVELEPELTPVEQRLFYEVTGERFSA